MRPLFSPLPIITRAEQWEQQTPYPPTSTTPQCIPETGTAGVRHPKHWIPILSQTDTPAFCPLRSLPPHTVWWLLMSWIVLVQTAGQAWDLVVWPGRGGEPRSTFCLHACEAAALAALDLWTVCIWWLVNPGSVWRAVVGCLPSQGNTQLFKERRVSRVVNSWRHSLPQCSTACTNTVIHSADIVFIWLSVFFSLRNLFLNIYIAAQFWFEKEAKMPN